VARVPPTRTDRRVGRYDGTKAPSNTCRPHKIEGTRIERQRTLKTVAPDRERQWNTAHDQEVCWLRAAGQHHCRAWNKK